MSEPLADSAMLASHLISQRAARQGIPVLLNGTGGDELFGGYNRYASKGILRSSLFSLSDTLRKKLASVLTGKNFEFFV